MRPRTIWKLARGGRMRSLRTLQRLSTPFYRVCFLGAAARAGLLRHLGSGPCSLASAAAALGVPDGLRDALAEWLEVGVRVRVLRRVPEGYALRGHLARQLARPENDDLAALLEEMSGLHHALLTATPARLQQGKRLTLADQDGTVVARSSRVLEPVIQEAIDDVIPRRGASRLLEIGCGSGTHIRHAAMRNPELEVLGLELQPDVARAATANLGTWGLADRARVEVGDVRERMPEPVYDVATLHQNIYYFPEAEHAAVLAHVRGFLKPGGTLLLTTGCRGGSAAMATLSLWGAVTEGCSALPTAGALANRFREAGFREVAHRNLLAPMDRFHAFTGIA